MSPTRRVCRGRTLLGGMIANGATERKARPLSGETPNTLGWIRSGTEFVTGTGQRGHWMMSRLWARLGVNRAQRAPRRHKGTCTRRTPTLGFAWVWLGGVAG
jgi:hypothetical protein